MEPPPTWLERLHGSTSANWPKTKNYQLTRKNRSIYLCEYNEFLYMFLYIKNWKHQPACCSLILRCWLSRDISGLTRTCRGWKNVWNELQTKISQNWFVQCDLLALSRVTLYTAVPQCSHSRAPIVHTAVPRDEHGCVYLRCTAVCKLPGCVEGHPWLSNRFENFHYTSTAE